MENGLTTTGQPKALATLADYEARIYLYREQIGTGYIGIGRTLIEAKDAGVVPHGSWESWVESTTGLSIQQAQRCMRAAREIKEGSALARLEMTKALAVLSSGLDEDAQETIAARAADDGTSLRELKRQLNDEKRLREEAEASREAAEQDARTWSELATSAANEADDLREKLKTVSKPGGISDEAQKIIDGLRADVSASQKWADEERKNYAATVAQLRDELEAAEAREAKKAATIKELRERGGGLAAPAERMATAATVPDVSAAVRAFIGAVGTVPQMGGRLCILPDEEREALRDCLATVERWCADTRLALEFVPPVDGSDVY